MQPHLSHHSHKHKHYTSTSHEVNRCINLKRKFSILLPGLDNVLFHIALNTYIGKAVTFGELLIKWAYVIHKSKFKNVLDTQKAERNK